MGRGGDSKRPRGSDEIGKYGAAGCYHRAIRETSTPPRSLDKLAAAAADDDDGGFASSSAVCGIFWKVFVRPIRSIYKIIFY